jgi:hypothetical protein
MPWRYVLGELGPKISAGEIEVVGFGVVGVAPCRRLWNIAPWPHLQPVGDGASDVFLDCQNVTHSPVVAFRPEVIAIIDTHELGGDT